MAESSSTPPLFGIFREYDDQQPPLRPPPPPPDLPKRKRNLPGTPSPDAEVVALSPKTLMTTNRFVCEVCSKGFQREQNLQLHRRGHNLPWKLKQKGGGKEGAVVRRKVYLCPVASCVHHDPARALGDLTGIKKHYSRKHGEKKWKCDKCAKRYAVRSDWKAHSKTCGTREYLCDCGTLFSRRDSFITHRAFCDALTQEAARNLHLGSTGHHFHGAAAAAAPALGFGGGQFDTILPPSTGLSSFTTPSSSSLSHNQDHPRWTAEASDHGLLAEKQLLQGVVQLPLHRDDPGFFNLGFFSDASLSSSTSSSSRSFFMEDQPGLPPFLRAPPLVQRGREFERDVAPAAPPHMSATALLQKAAQMGSTASADGGAASLLGGFGMTSTCETGFGVGGGLLSQSEAGMKDLMNFMAAGSGSGIYGEEPPGGSGVFEAGRGGEGGGGGTTRDFLGVGEMAAIGLSMGRSGGMSAGEPHCRWSPTE